MLKGYDEWLEAQTEAYLNEQDEANREWNELFDDIIDRFYDKEHEEALFNLVQDFEYDTLEDFHNILRGLNKPINPDAVRLMVKLIPEETGNLWDYLELDFTNDNIGKTVFDKVFEYAMDEIVRKPDEATKSIYSESDKKAIIFQYIISYRKDDIKDFFENLQVKGLLDDIELSKEVPLFLEA